MTATTSTPSRAAATSIVSSATFKTFALAFSLAFVVVYVLCVYFSWPLFTYFPATGGFFWGYEPVRRGEGPQMFWYGWIATCLIASTGVGILACVLPAGLTRRIPLALVWIVPILAMAAMAYSLMPFWTK
jgi:hypothetical protein